MGTISDFRTGTSVRGSTWYCNWSLTSVARATASWEGDREIVTEGQKAFYLVPKIPHDKHLHIQSR